MADQKSPDFRSWNEDAAKPWQFPKHLAANESPDGLFADTQGGVGGIDVQCLAVGSGRPGRRLPVDLEESALRSRSCWHVAPK